MGHRVAAAFAHFSSAAVAQAAGSPALSAEGRTATITPAAALEQGRTYKIQAVGGSSGVKDLAGTAIASTYTQSTGFSTVADATAPTISAVAASNVASTTARITWTTDEASDSQVFYRSTGTTDYQATTVDATKVTSNQVDLQGLVPATGYEYYVRSADAASNATNSAVSTFTTTANTNGYIRFEAESASTTAPVRGALGGGAGTSCRRTSGGGSRTRVARSSGSASSGRGPCGPCAAWP